MLKLSKKLKSMVVPYTLLIFFGAFHANLSTLANSPLHHNTQFSAQDHWSAADLRFTLADLETSDSESKLQKTRVLRKFKRPNFLTLNKSSYDSLTWFTCCAQPMKTERFANGPGCNNLNRIKKSFICGTPPPSAA